MVLMVYVVRGDNGVYMDHYRTRAENGDIYCIYFVPIFKVSSRITDIINYTMSRKYLHRNFFLKKRSKNIYLSPDWYGTLIYSQKSFIEKPKEKIYKWSNLRNKVTITNTPERSFGRA